LNFGETGFRVAPMEFRNVRLLRKRLGSERLGARVTGCFVLDNYPRFYYLHCNSLI